MTLTLDLPPDLQARLKAEAERTGVTPTEYALQLIRRALPQTQQVGEPDLATLKLFEEWDKEDETDDPNEIAARQREWEELKKGLEAARLSSRKLFP